MWHVLMRDETNYRFETNEIPVNGEPGYCSEKKKGSSTREERAIDSEEIEKDAIKGDLICLPKHSTCATIMRAKTSVYKTVSPFTAVCSGGKSTAPPQMASNIFSSIDFTGKTNFSEKT
jgi:hypothetical protein